MIARVRMDDCGEVRLELASEGQLEADLLGLFETQHHAGGIYLAAGAVDTDSGRRDLQIRPLLGSRLHALSRSAG